jgi:hypothetical protein
MAKIPPASAFSLIASFVLPGVFRIAIFSLSAAPLAETFTYVSPNAFPKVRSFPSTTLAVMPPAPDTKVIAPGSEP